MYIYVCVIVCVCMCEVENRDGRPSIFAICTTHRIANTQRDTHARRAQQHGREQHAPGRHTHTAMHSHTERTTHSIYTGLKYMPMLPTMIVNRTTETDVRIYIYSGLCSVVEYGEKVAVMFSVGVHRATVI